MNALIYAIFSCVAAGNTGYCHQMGEPFLFQSADQCITALTTQLSHHGNLVDGRLYTTQPGSSKTWFECEQRPSSQWQAVQAPPAQPERVPYVLMHCIGTQCVKSSVVSVSKKACEISMALAAESDTSGSYECIKLQL